VALVRFYNIFTLKKYKSCYISKGKTTLLNSLTFKNSGDLQISGDVKVNGRKINKSSELASISGYVEQDDIFIGTLTVKEHLKFQV
jgi:ABC-type multidrug transport system ATPase subunit